MEIENDFAEKKRQTSSKKELENDSAEKKVQSSTKKEMENSSAEKKVQSSTKKAMENSSADKNGQSSSKKEVENSSAEKKGQYSTKKEMENSSVEKKGQSSTKKEMENSSADKKGQSSTKKEMENSSAEKKGQSSTKKEMENSSVEKKGQSSTKKEMENSSADKKGQSSTKKEMENSSAEKNGQSSTKKEMENSYALKKKGKSCAKNKKCRIDRTMLPIKAFYFMNNVAMACLVPYLVIYLKSRGLTSGETGVIFGVMSFLGFLVQPLVGMLADRWRCHKGVLVIASVLSGAFHLLLTAVPPRLAHNDVIRGDVTVVCSPDALLAVTYYAGGHYQYHQAEGGAVVNCLEGDAETNGYYRETSDSDSSSSSSLVDSYLTSGFNLTSSRTGNVVTSDSDLKTFMVDRDAARRRDDEDEDSCPTDIGQVLQAIYRNSHHDNSSVFRPARTCRLVCPGLDGSDSGSGAFCKTSSVHYNNTTRVFHQVCNSSNFDNNVVSFTVTGLQRSRDNVLYNESRILPYNRSREIFSEFKNQSGREEEDPHGRSRCITVDVFHVSSLVDDNQQTYSTVLCPSPRELSCQLQCLPPPDGDPCQGENNSASFDVTFWLFFLAYLAASTAFAPLIPMGDAVCYSLLGDQWRKYGRQRVWGTLGWLVTSLGTTAGIYVVGDLNLGALFYCHAGLTLVTAAIACTLRMPPDVRCGNMMRDLGAVLRMPRVLALLWVGLVFGVLFGSISTFLLWYLEDLGASPQLFGPVNAVGVLAEVPAFLVVGKVIQRLGPVTCISLGMLLTSARLLGHALLGNPWLSLLVEPLHGLHVALMQAGTSTYVTWLTPARMSATAQGLLGGVMHSLGRAVGMLLTGWLLGAVGPRVTWASYAVAGCVVTATYVIINRCLFSDVIRQPSSRADNELHITENGEALTPETHVPLMAKDVNDCQNAASSDAADSDKFEAASSDAVHIGVDTNLTVNVGNQHTSV